MGISEQLHEAGLTGWWADEQLHARFLTGDFATGIRFVNAVGRAAEEAGHHPDLLLRYPSVDVTLTSHDVGAITDRDLALALRIQEVADRLLIPVGPQLADD